MRALLFTAIAGFAAVSAAAMAQPPGPKDKATLCLDGLGINHAPVCHSQTASRLPTPPDICQCLGPWRQVDAPYCAKGEKPPADSAAFERARIAFAEKHGDSVIGATYEGKRMCVELGNGG